MPIHWCQGFYSLQILAYTGLLHSHIDSCSSFVILSSILLPPGENLKYFTRKNILSCFKIFLHHFNENPTYLCFEGTCLWSRYLKLNLESSYNVLIIVSLGGYCTSQFIIEPSLGWDSSFLRMNCSAGWMTMIMLDACLHCQVSVY